MNTVQVRHVPLFTTLPDAEIALLAAALRPTAYPAGAILFREGDCGDRIYIVLSGQIAIVSALGTANEHVLGLRGVGEVVGEMSLFDPNGRRAASGRVQADAQLLELTHDDFDALLRRQPRLAYDLLRVLSTRLRDSEHALIRDLQAQNRQLAQAYADLQAAQAQIIEKETLERELQLAREIQESMLPHAMPRLEGFDIGARIVPARAVGGDLFDVFPLGSDSLGLMIGDVSGKGVPAAMFMALTRSLLRAEALRATTPETALRSVNRHLLEMNAAGMFVTVVYGILQQKTRAFCYARAGHELPRVWDASGASLSYAWGFGHPLGLLEEPSLDCRTIGMPPGGTLLLITDGVTEATDHCGAFFGPERLEMAVRASPARSAQRLCDDLVVTLADYHGEAPQHDDITLVAVRAGVNDYVEPCIP
ncbi:MAG TPA: SpoIIE family protein phosphatase [Roseiflexaceae bacterium]|nr:SpoIIE family protein phosphatase [Roseiflexaceae bacterium]